MRKQLFSMMLCLGAVGGASFVTPMPAMAAVAQDQVITVLSLIHIYLRLWQNLERKAIDQQV